MKIGFIAMSGVRVHSTELLELGLNLPGFVERSKVIASLPSLGLLTLAGMTPPDIEVEYIEVADLDRGRLAILILDMTNTLTTALAAQSLAPLAV